MDMNQFKAICTITWKFESDKSIRDCLEHAKNQLDQIMVCNPQGEEYDDFCVQMDIATLKEKKKLIHIKTYDCQEIFDHIALDEKKREYIINGVSYIVKMNSDRYVLFMQNRKCVACGLEGTKMILDINPGDQSPHFNLYTEENGRLVLMTKDHIIPKSKNGKDEIDNYQCMCSICNNLKGNYNITHEQIRNLRKHYQNVDKMQKKELRELINNLREEYSQAALIKIDEINK